MVLEFIQGATFLDWFTAVSGVIAACSAITALTPTKTDDAILDGVLKVLNFLSLNILKNKNDDDK